VRIRAVVCGSASLQYGTLCSDNSDWSNWYVLDIVSNCWRDQWFTLSGAGFVWLVEVSPVFVPGTPTPPTPADQDTEELRGELRVLQSRVGAIEGALRRVRDTLDLER